MPNTRETSKEEIYTLKYFEELKENGFVKEIIYQPDPIILSEQVLIKIEKKLKTKSKLEDKVLISKHIYTPDFLIIWNGPNKFHQDIYQESYEKWPLFFSISNRSFIEVKAVFDRNNSTRHFTSAIQPWIFQKYLIYVNLIKIPDLFKETFIPNDILEDFYYKVNGKKFKKNDPKFKWCYRTLKDYING